MATKQEHPGIRAGFAKLMDSSELRLYEAARGGTLDEQRLARTLLDEVPIYRRWEGLHGQLMREVARQRGVSSQAATLRKITCSLIHRQAPFQYLKHRHVTGGARRRLVESFYGARSYAKSIIREHVSYLTTASSQLCTVHLGKTLFGDQTIESELALYQELYSDYFRVFCDCLTAEANPIELDSVRALLPYLKQRANEARQAIIAGPTTDIGDSATLRLIQLRRPTDDTLRIRKLHAA